MSAVGIQDIVRAAREIELKIAKLKDDYDREKAKIQKYFDEKGTKSVEVVSQTEGHTVLVASKVERITINYNAEALKEKLKREVYEEIVDKSYFIKDVEGLKYALRSRGVTGEEFRGLVGVTESINKEKIKQLYSIGDIKQAQLNGCYTATISKSVQIKERKRGDRD